MIQGQITKKPLLTFNNFKTLKNSQFVNEVSGKPYKSYILYMSPFKNNSKGVNVCSHASKGCADSCLNLSGFGGLYAGVQRGRIEKTEYFLRDRVGFLNQIDKEITELKRKYSDKYCLTIRLNGTSDIRYEAFKVFNGLNIFEKHSDVIFYDYTKNYLRFEKTLPNNYYLTFSRSETNDIKAMEILKRGFNVSMVFYGGLPKYYRGFEVINGDESDLRNDDKKGVIVGLKYKYSVGKGAEKNNKAALESGFAINIKPYKEIMKKYNALIERIKSNVIEEEFEIV